jgi:hypothetical protein
MQRNYLRDAGWLILILLVGCLLIGFIPEFKVGKSRLKKMNLLSDLRKSKIETKKKSLAAKKKPSKSIAKEKTKSVKSKNCKPGITCLEDFSAGNNMRYFLQSLSKTKSKAIRVAFFGDSFIEGDMLCANFRDTLQQLYGGRGVGFVPITSEVAQFRTTIQHQFENWQTYSIVSKKSSLYTLGISGHCFVPLPENYVEYKPAKKRSAYFTNVRVFYKNPWQSSIDYLLNDTLQTKTALSTADSIQQFEINEEKIQSIRLSFTETDSLKLYGASFENGNGIFIDNFSMRGNSGIGLSLIPDNQLRQFNHLQQYKLIILQYGLNVVSLTDSTNFTSYQIGMVRVINRLKKIFPETSFLLLSVSDRASNQNGKFATYPDIPLMRDVQREIAKQCKITFWDMYEAMGGENSMVKFAEAKPTLAAKDYTHLTYWGGKKIALKLVNALLYEQKRHAK